MYLALTLLDRQLAQLPTDAWATWHYEEIVAEQKPTEVTSVRTSGAVQGSIGCAGSCMHVAAALTRCDAAHSTFHCRLIPA